MQEDEKFKVVCGHKMSLSSTWVPQDPVPKYQNQKKKKSQENSKDSRVYFYFVLDLFYIYVRVCAWHMCFNCAP